MNLHSSRIAATFAALVISAASFALAGCGDEDSTDTGSEEIVEKSTQTPPSRADQAPHVEVGSPDLGLGKQNPDPTDNVPPTKALPQ